MRSLILTLVLLVWSPASWAQEQKQAFDTSYGAPGPQHQLLQSFVGQWDLVLKIEGAPDAKGTASFRSLYGGRFLVEEVQCSMFGSKFEWMGIYGYDKTKKKYTAVWVDNLDTNIEAGEGDATVTGKGITLQGEHPDPRTGKMGRFRWVLVSGGKDKLRIEMHESEAGGKEAKVMELIGTRKK